MVLTCVAIAALSPQPFRPDPVELRALYRRADEIRALGAGKVLNQRIAPVWIGTDLAYRRETSSQTGEYIRIRPSGQRGPLFDHAKVAEGLAALAGSAVKPDELNLVTPAPADEGKTLRVQFRGSRYEIDLATSQVRKGAAPPPAKPEPDRTVSPDGKWQLRLREGQVEVRATASEVWKAVTTAGQFERAEWSPGSNRIVAVRVVPGDRRQVSVLQSNKPNATRSELRTRFYDQPGDKLDQSEIYILDPQASTESKVALPPLDNGGHPWAEPVSVRWWKPKGATADSFLVEETERGFGRFRVHRVWLDGTVKTVIDDDPETFVHTSQLFWRPLQQREALLYRSEQSGGAMLVEFDGKTGASKPVTTGEFVVREVENIDEAKGVVTFTANGKEPGDPYFVHQYRTNLDGTGLKRLTDGEGTHTTAWSPDRSSFIDTFSSAISPPKHVWRRADGSKIADVESADGAGLAAAGVPRPEVFVAKGRDGETDIWGLIYRPSQVRPDTKYPVVENIYAGPHDSHVPKAWQNVSGSQQMAELGFIVVQIDGMGTANRGKKFHDVCYKNIADAGFPDRIAWIKAAAAKYPEIDAERVGIFGTSAGGQNAAGAVLFRPEFYNVAVASCGCHDNRIDKQWWNEQWMGYPVGPHYEAQSNITNAGKLVGHLLLIVGEVDTNVPPESTFRFADALEKAGKEFELVVVPGADHTSGGLYGERKRRDFLVRYLHGVEPPRWNAPG